MPHSGETLGADLANLYDAGRYQLPVLAKQFGAAKEMLIGTHVSNSMFARDPQLGGRVGPARAAWDLLRDEVVGLLATTEDNLLSTAEALMMAAEEYASTDEAAMARFRREQAQLDRVYQSL